MDVDVPWLHGRVREQPQRRCSLSAQSWRATRLPGSAISDGGGRRCFGCGGRRSARRAARCDLVVHLRRPHQSQPFSCHPSCSSCGIRRYRPCFCRRCGSEDSAAGAPRTRAGSELNLASCHHPAASASTNCSGFGSGYYSDCICCSAAGPCASPSDYESRATESSDCEIFRFESASRCSPESSGSARSEARLSVRRLAEVED